MSRRDAPVMSPLTPARLAVPTDLDLGQVHAVAEVVNGLVADAFALYVKTKNFHWHLAGSHFRDYHLLFDEQAEAIIGSIDILAERVRRLGATTLRSVGHISRIQSIEDDDDEFVPPDEMVQRLIADNQQICRRQREAVEICEQNKDLATANILQALLDQTEKRIWFLYEIAPGEDEE